MVTRQVLGESLYDMSQAVGVVNVRQPLGVAVIVVIDDMGGRFGAFGDMRQESAAAESIDYRISRAIAWDVAIKQGGKSGDETAFFGRRREAELVYVS